MLLGALFVFLGCSWADLGVVFGDLVVVLGWSLGGLGVIFWWFFSGLEVALSGLGWTWGGLGVVFWWSWGDLVVVLGGLWVVWAQKTNKCNPINSLMFYWFSFSLNPKP